MLVVGDFDADGLTGAAILIRALRAAGAGMSLFGDKKIIELRIPTGKPGRDGSEALQRYGHLSAAEMEAQVRGYHDFLRTTQIVPSSFVLVAAS